MYIVCLIILLNWIPNSLYYQHKLLVTLLFYPSIFLCASICRPMCVVLMLLLLLLLLLLLIMMMLVLVAVNNFNKALY